MRVALGGLATHKGETAPSAKPRAVPHLSNQSKTLSQRPLKRSPRRSL